MEKGKKILMILLVFNWQNFKIMANIVGKLWGFCHTLRHDGMDKRIVSVISKGRPKNHPAMDITRQLDLQIIDISK